MSAQLVEILILAVVAFFIISKLLAILGTTDEDDPAHKAKSMFGEPTGLKDVTSITETVAQRGKSKVIVLRPDAVYSTDAKTNEIIKQILEKMPDFNHEKFLKGAKGAFKMVLEAINKSDIKTLESLVDKRFLEELTKKSGSYDKIDSADMSVKFEDAYSFGNSIYIKVIITGKKFKEFWVFTRNLNQSGPDWYLSNIETSA